jgi:hypothetical protein
MTLADLDKEAEKRPVSRREFYMVGYRAALSECLNQCLQVVEEEKQKLLDNARPWNPEIAEGIRTCERIDKRLREIGAVHD